MMDWITVDNVKSFVRHVLTFAGGYLVPAGAAAGSDLEVVIGGLSTLAGLVWSYMTHKPEPQA